jgi:cell division protein FtsA
MIQLNFTHYDLKRIVNHVLTEEMETLSGKLANSLRGYNYPVVVVGEILRISVVVVGLKKICWN